ncbi:MAG: sugar ABC transporter permease [Marinovum algicola]|uniref:Carbohydrate ABC transporter membrane protein 1, CUT1 family n=1 Tax=Marinovum algicola TaxID=42444 RepID=A0A975W753_9RHOB|nr:MULTISPECIES: sugar ABC transporter permease [Marinovum]MDD9741002.1 sugar ABC transporter permease [Marinovum sp. SP66]MDD9742775.1 sugar ABC transporter permease [Marinovum sp. PR37]SEI61221.1 carbohydrate ABC transporter membrane protein 1, CUT1 family [Marinovum algicola]SLN26122.1 Lactose transport system permease protein LacF [Marinovum algicola]
MSSKLTRSNRAGWLFALPGFSLLFLFIIVPFFFAFWLSLTNQRLVSPNPTEFVGLKNYADLLSVSVLTLEPERDEAGEIRRDDDGAIAYPRVRSITRSDEFPQYRGMREWFRWHWGDKAKVVIASDVVFMKALVNTLTFALFIVPLQGGGALLLALLINQKLRGINAFRTIYFMPVVISIVVISLLWRFIYSGNEGLLNNILEALTFGAFTPVDWLGSTDTALGSIIAMSAWQAVGFHMVIWLAGLQTISPTLYEAAAIEGASKWQTFRYVTWPGLRNTAVLVLIVITMQSFAVFAQIDVMTNGGPLDSTQTLVFQTVERGYGKQDISGGATISVILFLMVLMISAVQAFLTRERN